MGVFGLEVVQVRGDFHLTGVEMGLSCAAVVSDLSLRFWGVESGLDRAESGLTAMMAGIVRSFRGLGIGSEGFGEVGLGLGISKIKSDVGEI